ncbi:MAG: hypothetical protein JO261_06225 [Alphaproteobacteria bacterium]|nr:hypothetical protein [Alphaproteobacteria bacterium]MBV9693280.1 hypothetical protein [Alphaproteobacteria bacterium]
MALALGLREIDAISERSKGKAMRSCLLILLGVPIPLVLLLWFLTGHL